MISKNEMKMVRSLAQKKFRDELGLFVVEGEKMVEEALHSDMEVVNVWRTEEIGEEAMSRITMLSSPSPALALVRKRDGIGDIGALAASRPLMLALDSVRDPGNLGTIIRLADWFGIDAVAASHDTVDFYNPKTVQSTMGAIFRVKFFNCDLDVLLSSFRERGMNVYGTFLEGDDIYGAPLDSCGVIVMGSESNGISPAIAHHVTQKLFIPPYPADTRGSESLNVAIATAITCSEFRRR